MKVFKSYCYFSFVDHKSVIKELSSTNRKAVYILHGDEPFYIDLIEKFASEHLIPEDAQGFDQTIFYGKETDLNTVLNTAKRFPLMGDFQLIVVREAQNIKKYDELITYLQNPQPQSVIIFALKGKKIDARTLKKFEGSFSVFESKKLYDNQIPAWIVQLAQSKKMSIDDKTATLIAEYLGNDLNKIANEITKLDTLLVGNKTITAEIVEHNIGISKEFNFFELNSALARRNILQANRIINHFSANPKNYPLVVTIGSLYKFFNSVLLAHFCENNSSDFLAKKLQLNFFAAKDCEAGTRHYSKKKLAEIFELLNEFDLKSKGYGNTNTSEGDLLKELTYRILH